MSTDDAVYRFKIIMRDSTHYERYYKNPKDIALKLYAADQYKQTWLVFELSSGAEMYRIANICWLGYEIVEANSIRTAAVVTDFKLE